MATLRRLVLLMLVIGAGAVALTAWQRRRVDHAEDAAAPEWPPFAEPSPAAWVEPVDGNCPDGFPVKVNGDSGIFHVPGGRFYDRTTPDRCYRSAEAATDDGYRAAKA